MDGFFGVWILQFFEVYFWVKTQDEFVAAMKVRSNGEIQGSVAIDWVYYQSILPVERIRVI